MQRKKKKSFFAVCPRRLFLIPIFCICFGLQTVQATERELLIPVGKTVGVTLDTDGFLVIGTGVIIDANNESVLPAKELRVGDRILEVDGKKLENKEAFREAVEKGEGRVMQLLLERDGIQKQIAVTPVFSSVDQAYKIGIWIRDSIQGIGTVTFYNPNNERFAALGHGIYDVDTGNLMSIRNGSLIASELAEIIKGRKGMAGELYGKANFQEKIAVIDKNTEVGIFGTAKMNVFAGNAIPMAEVAEIRQGKAVILSDLEGNGVKEYAVQIERIQKSGGKEHKDMLLRVTDERLLRLTGGIVQGMSGSPIIQDGKLVGAVTHVLVNDPTRGYGIFIENMLEAAA